MSNLKNQHIKNLSKIVPIDIRLETYKETLKLFDKEIELVFSARNKLNELSLCLVLPMVMWGMKAVTDRQPDGKVWEYWNTVNAFPEFTSGDKLKIELSKVKSDRNNIRVKLLKKYIKQLKS